jgi:nucleotide-binding universal stress UspA family protein
MYSLITSGFLEENIFCKVKRRMLSAAKDIIHEGNHGLYDAVVLGRRGIGRLEELINDSVSIRVLEEKRTSPIWVCRKIDPDRQHVLVCVDGSQESLRMVDHVGFFLSGEEQHKVTLLHVAQEPVDTQMIFRQAMEALEENDVSPSRVQSKVVESSNVAGAIKSEAEAGRFSAVAMGFTGKGRRGVFTIGSVSTKLCYEVTGSALWIG